MKKTNRMISVIMTLVILASSFLCLIPMTASAIQVDNETYQFVLLNDNPIVPSEFIESIGRDPTLSFVFTPYVNITLSTGFSGLGQIGYSGSGCFYITIFDYVDLGANWVLKYDSSGNWKYRTLTDEGTVTDYEVYDPAGEPIYFIINDGYYEIDSRLTMTGLIHDTAEWFSYYDDGVLYDTFPYLSHNTTITIMDMSYTKDGYYFIGWTDGDKLWRPGDTCKIADLNSATLTAAWSESPLTTPTTYYFYNEGSLYAQITSANDLIIIPKMTETKEGFDFIGWSDGLFIHKVGEIHAVADLNSTTLTAVWEASLDRYVTFKGEGFKEFTLLTDTNGIITMPALPEGTTRDGYSFQGWSDGAYIYTVGMTYNCATKNNYTFTAFWQEVSTGPGTGSDDDENFIVNFIFGTYDNLKAEILPIFNSFKIPFINVTLKEFISFIVGAVIVILVVWLISKARG